MQACVDSTLNADKRNGQSLTSCIFMVDNAPMALKVLMQGSKEKSTHSGKFAAYSSIADEALRARDIV